MQMDQRQAECHRVVHAVKQFYQSAGQTVVRRAVGYGLEGYQFAETIEDADLMLFIDVAKQFSPTHIFVIGNSWGWGCCCLSRIFPGAFIDVIDAEIEGLDVAFGSDITRRLITNFRLPIALKKMKSPQDVRLAAEGKKYDLVMINGRHGDMQLIEDFLAVVPILKPKSLVVMPAVARAKIRRGFGIVKMAGSQMGFDWFGEVDSVGTCIASKGVYIDRKRTRIREHVPVLEEDQ